MKAISEELQILLAPDKEYQKVFPKVPIVGFCKSLTSYTKKYSRH